MNIAIVILFAFLSTISQVISGPIVIKELTGEVQTSYYSLSGDLGSSEKQRFTMVTDGKHFRVRLEKPNQDMATDYKEIAWDGTNCYYVNTMPTWVQRQREKGANVGDNIATAAITTVPVPQFELAEAAGILWCTYISPSYLKQTSPKKPIYTPFSTQMKNGRDAEVGDFLTFPAVWQFSPTTDYIEELYYVTENKKQLSQAFTNAIFKTLQWTNVGGEKIPSFTTATLFVRNPTSIRKSAEYTLTLHSVDRLGSVQIGFQPTLPGPTVIIEERFNWPNGNLHFMYLVKSNWLPLTEAKALKGYREAAALAPALRETKSRVPLFIKMFFILLVIAPVIFIWKQGHLRSKNI